MAFSTKRSTYYSVENTENSAFASLVIKSKGRSALIPIATLGHCIFPMRTGTRHVAGGAEGSSLALLYCTIGRG
jgi:hypothetical protein